MFCFVVMRWSEITIYMYMCVSNLPIRFNWTANIIYKQTNCLHPFSYLRLPAVFFGYIECLFSNFSGANQIPWNEAQFKTTTWAFISFCCSYICFLNLNLKINLLFGFHFTYLDWICKQITTNRCSHYQTNTSLVFFFYK